jgi:uncharacterized protein (DUF2384 family)
MPNKQKRANTKRLSSSKRSRQSPNVIDGISADSNDIDSVGRHGSELEFFAKPGLMRRKTGVTELRLKKTMELLRQENLRETELKAIKGNISIVFTVSSSNRSSGRAVKHRLEAGAVRRHRRRERSTRLEKENLSEFAPLANAVFENESDADAWLNTPREVFENKSALEFATTDRKKREVKKELLKIEYGVVD